MVNSQALEVTVVYSPAPRVVDQVTLHLAVPCRVVKAVQQSGLLAKYPELDNMGIQLGVWGRKVKLDQALRDQDRIEIYRPLRVDPKVARRERFVKQGARAAGLFVKNRQGSQLPAAKTR